MVGVVCRVRVTWAGKLESSEKSVVGVREGLRQGARQL